MENTSVNYKSKAGQSEFKKSIAKFHNPSLKKSLWQLANSFVPYFVLWAFMIFSMNISYWLTLAIAVPAAGFMVRLFIIFHDCGHGSFFKSEQANNIVGSLTGILTFTPYFQWRYQHALHHSTSGDLDRRGIGDVWTMTVNEYKDASSWRRLAYRVYRNPFVMIVIGPLVMFLIVHRLVSLKEKRRERHSVHWTNLALFAIAVIMSLTIGFKAYILIQIPVLMIAGSAGIWLFYVQHQFEGVYWERSDQWDFVAASIHGSSFYKLPKVLQWFSGNIGFHHIHHLNSRIPNYNLEECHKENAVFQKVKPVTLGSSLKSLSFRLYDEKQRRLVHFRALKHADL
ncbi:fatty acid desaturase [candidate division KSB1 bacterium RBG_16_48_16]|nr:MAG: fatty acid desaturase [candidate division KSB1 bacterium RBG_16_48_16]